MIMVFPPFSHHQQNMWTQDSSSSCVSYLICTIHPLDIKHAFRIGLSIRLSSEAKTERIMYYWPSVGKFINMICMYTSWSVKLLQHDVTVWKHACHSVNTLVKTWVWTCINVNITVWIRENANVTVWIRRRVNYISQCEYVKTWMPQCEYVKTWLSQCEYVSENVSVDMHKREYHSVNTWKRKCHSVNTQTRELYITVWIRENVNATVRIRENVTVTVWIR